MFPQIIRPKYIEHVDPAALERDLIEELLARGESSAQIKIVVLTGKVFLDGVVGSYREKLLAEKVCTGFVPSLPTVNRLRVVPDVLSQPQIHQTNSRAS